MDLVHQADLLRQVLGAQGQVAPVLYVRRNLERKLTGRVLVLGLLDPAHKLGRLLTRDEGVGVGHSSFEELESNPFRSRQRQVNRPPGIGEGLQRRERGTCSKIFSDGVGRAVLGFPCVPLRWVGGCVLVFGWASLL